MAAVRKYSTQYSTSTVRSCCPQLQTIKKKKKIEKEWRSGKKRIESDEAKKKKKKKKKPLETIREVAYAGFSESLFNRCSGRRFLFTQRRHCRSRSLPREQSTPPHLLSHRTTHTHTHTPTRTHTHTHTDVSLVCLFPHWFAAALFTYDIN